VEKFVSEKKEGKKKEAGMKKPAAKKDSKPVKKK